MRDKRAAQPRAIIGFPFDLVIFDLDGTLVDTAPDIADSVNAALREHGLPPIAESAVRDGIGHGTRTLITKVLGDRDTPSLDEMLETYAKHFAAHCGRRGRLYQDVAGSLALLRASGIKLALLTNKEARFTEFVLKVHGLDDDFDLVVCGDTLSAKKPDGAVIRHCLDSLRIAPSRALLVGDSITDVETGRNAAIAVWAVPYGYNRGRPISEAGPDRIIPTLRLLADSAVAEPEPA